MAKGVQGGVTKATSKASVDEWITKSVRGTVGKTCTTCKPPYNQKVLDILEAMIRLQAHKITRRDIYAKVKEDCPDYPLTFNGFERHLLNCIRKTWDQAQGKIGKAV